MLFHLLLEIEIAISDEWIWTEKHRFLDPSNHKKLVKIDGMRSIEKVSGDIEGHLLDIIKQ